MRYSRLIILSFIFLLSQSILLPQSALRKGFKLGIEGMSFLSGNNGSFSNEPGYGFGVFTGIDFYESSKNAFILRLELNYNKLVAYRTNHYLFYSDAITFQKNSYILEDQRTKFYFVDLGIIPEYFFKLNDKTLLSFYLGPSVGAGPEYISELAKERNLSPYALLVDYYDEYNSSFISNIGINLGTNLYYDIYFVSLRYRFSHFSGTVMFNDFHRLNLEGGLAF